ncbi:hypothetical protein KW801_01365 [Candidatus Saccharibacteria bacterium]|nr:hypothetical protein [Candidatus Saccharibacteria bacterium]
MQEQEKAKTAQTNNKSSLLRHTSRFSRAQLAIIILVFAAVGGYILWQSFAAGTPVSSLEAEQMILPAGGSVITDANASGGKAVDLSTNGSATGSVNFASAITSLTITARGGQCQGAPQMVISLDGASLINTSVSTTSWTAYNATANYAAGTHSLSVSFPNDFTKSKGKRSCSRDLYLDVTNFYGNVTPPPAAPTVSLSASPTSVSAGQAATLTWNSSNATACAASGAWSGSQPTSGSTSTGALNQTSSYTLTCTGSGGSTSATTSVAVTAPVIPPAPTIYFNPPSQNFSVGSTFTIDIRENSGSATVNAVQANFSYPSDKLTFVSADASASPFTTEAQNTGSNGQVSLARGIIGSLSGDQLISKITFKVNVAGVANLSFVNGTALISSTSNQNIIGSLAADGIGVYTLQ